MGPGKYDLVIFDCDGTLVDSEYVNNEAVVRMLRDYGHTQFDLDYSYKHFLGTHMRDILAHVAELTGWISPGENEAGAVFRRHTAILAPDHLKVVDGARDLVAYASSRGKVCVASNGQYGDVISSLTVSGVLPLLEPDSVFVGAMVARAKPAPDLFLYAAEKKGVDPARTLVIEDSVPGVRGAVAAGMTVVGVTGTSHNPKAHAAVLRDLGAHYLTERLIHIPDLTGL